MPRVGRGQQVAGQPGGEEPAALGKGELQVIPGQAVAERRERQGRHGERDEQGGAESHGAGRRIPPASRRGAGGRPGLSYGEEAHMALEVGRKAPDFTLPDQDGNPVKLPGFKGKRVVVFFYPKASTPG